MNVDTSRFELDESRMIFTSQSHAVNAFAQAIKLPLEDLSGSASLSSVEGEDMLSDVSNLSALDRHAAIRFWGLKVGRGILMDVGEGVNFEFVNRAFGGLRATLEEDDNEDDGRERLQEDIDPNEEEQEISELHILTRSPQRHNRHLQPEVTSDVDADEGHDDGNSSEDQDDDDDDSYSDSDSSDYDSEEERFRDDEDDEFGISTQLPSTWRNSVESHVPCSSHINVYQGHCNVKTVKDVNYFGLDDEYVVSGSDDGNVFIWDRKTSDLLNILNGDSEVVNVVQGTRSPFFDKI